ncbi:hypothetical protein J4447_04175 [Candidatus Pacearchaeota archaeon]|nr:hypothetical protein [Candidatus Pacearchaeota archaeon]
MTIKKTLADIVLTGALALVGVGCSHHPQYQEGKVTKESGTVVNIVESSGALFGNESVKFGNPNYVLTVETDQGKYTINVEGRYSKPLAALAEAIEVGDRIKFKTNHWGGKDRDYFSRDRIGSVPSDEIELLGK